jgi:hypothetical protein
LYHAAELIECRLGNGFGPAATMPGAQRFARDRVGYDRILDDAVTIKSDCDGRLDKVYATHGWINQKFEVY